MVGRNWEFFNHPLNEVELMVGRNWDLLFAHPLHHAQIVSLSPNLIAVNLRCYRLFLVWCGVVRWRPQS
ncbi:unnamed protein product [Calypogeia fissa]